MTIVGILGLGEAGSAIGRDLVAAGVRVRGFDPVASADWAEVVDHAAGVARGADAVLSLNSAAVSEQAAASVAGALAPGTLFADLNASAPAVKRAVEDVIARAGGVFVDVALMGPVPGRGVRAPCLVSGPGAERYAQLFAPLGAPVTVVSAHAGDAAARKLARSVFAKGLAAAIGESLAAAEQLDCFEWLYAELERTLVEADGAFLRRLIDGSLQHAARRGDELAAAVAMLEELGVEPRIAAAAEGWLRSLARREVLS